MPDADLPSSPRHGTVLPVTQAELDRMRLNLQPNLLVESVDPLTATTKAGTAPVLPEKATVHFADGSTKQKSVDWDDIDPAKYADLGTFEVEGDVAPGSTVRAKATVTVTDALDPSVTLSTDPATPDGDGRLVGVRAGQRHRCPASTIVEVAECRDVGRRGPVDAASTRDEVTVPVSGEGAHSGTREGNRRRAATSRRCRRSTSRSTPRRRSAR